MHIVISSYVKKRQEKKNSENIKNYKVFYPPEKSTQINVW